MSPVFGAGRYSTDYRHVSHGDVTCPPGAFAKSPEPRYTAYVMRGACALWLLLWTASAVAGPRVTVRARTQVSLAPVERTPDGALVSGRIFEPATGAPVPFAPVVLRFDDQEVTVTSDEAGTFRRTFPVADGKHRLDVRFQGNSGYVGASLEKADFDISRSPLAIALAVATRQPGDDRVTVTVSTTSRGLGVPVPFTLSVSPLGGKEVTRITGETDASGTKELAIAVANIGAPGRYTLRASSPASETYDPAASDASWLFHAETSLSLDGPAAAERREQLRLSGRLVTDLGQGVPGAAVALFQGDERLLGVVTETDGSFRARLDARDVPLGNVQLVARFTSNRPWLASAAATPLTIEITKTPPIPSGLLVGLFIAAVLPLLAFLALKGRPWHRFRRARRDEQDKERSRVRGLQPGRAPLGSSLGKANDFRFGGRVVDGAECPLPNASITLQIGERDLTVHTDSAGTFLFDTLAPGSYTASVRCPAYVSEHFTVAIPHRGHLTSVTVTLVEIRQHIFDRYRRAVALAMSSPKQLAVLTPRELLRVVRKSHPAPALGALTDYVEVIFFSGAIPDEEEIQTAERNARAAEAEWGGHTQAT